MKKYVHSKAIVEKSILEIMEFEKELNSILEPTGIEPTYFNYALLEGKYKDAV
jgi:hypothetical protein